MGRKPIRKIIQIPVAKIVEPTFFVRDEDHHSVEIATLAKSIKEKGQIQAIIVRAVDEHYVLIVGWRRWKAHLYAELPFIDAEVKIMTDDEMIGVRWAENEDRAEVNPADGCRFVNEAKILTGKNQKEIAEMLGKTEGYVSQRLSVLQGFATVFEALKGNFITFAQARELVKYPNEETAVRYIDVCKHGGASPEYLRKWRSDEEMNQDIPEDDRPDILPEKNEQWQEPLFLCECCREQKAMSILAMMKLCSPCKLDVIQAFLAAQGELEKGESDV